MSPFEPWRERADLTLDEVVDAADRLLREVAPKQTRWAVTERPDVRTVRYYTTRGLLPKALGYEGGRARYGFSHLVRLLAIKRMQAEHMTLEQVARVLAKSDDETLALLVETREKPEPAALPPPSAGRVERIESDVPDVDGKPLTLALEPGGKLVVDAAVISDPAKRKLLADNLEMLARFLRASDMGNKGGSNA